ncbi:MAG: phosphonate C-P lyase system protein PhnG [Pseudomonadota bacterium]
MPERAQHASSGEESARAAWLGLLSRADPSLLEERLKAAKEALGGLPNWRWLRPPETGSVMLRGRTGGTGAPFNLGEMTVTRCTLSLEAGAVGHAMVPGSDRSHAERVALLDALMQDDAARKTLRQTLIDPLRLAERETATKRAGRAAATKVDFFTMVRGENT